jgi:hypothetical protein
MQKAFERSELLGIKDTAPMIVGLFFDAAGEGAESGVLGTNGSGTSKRRWLFCVAHVRVGGRLG